MFSESKHIQLYLNPEQDGLSQLYIAGRPATEPTC